MPKHSHACQLAPRAALPPRRSDYGRKCSLDCRERSSAIVLSPAYERGGLNDRIATLRSLGSLAHSLCAWLVAPPPCQLLMSSEMMGMRCDRLRLQWNHVTNLSFSRSPSGPIPLMAGVRDPILRPSLGALVLNATSSAPLLLRQYRNALSAANTGRRFVWHIRLPLYRWVMRFKHEVQQAYKCSPPSSSHNWSRTSRPSYSTSFPPPAVSYGVPSSCVYVSGSSSHSELSIRLRDAFYSHNLGLRVGTYDDLHIRRHLRNGWADPLTKAALSGHTPYLTAPRCGSCMHGFHFTA